MDGKDLIASASDLQSFYEQQQHHHRPALGGSGHSPSTQQQQLAGMHSIIRPMPNMNMSATAILNSIGGMQFQMDHPTPSSLLHNNNNNTVVSVSGPAAPGTAPPPPAEPVKRKRGRPRKYGPDGTMKASSSAAAAAQQHQHHQQLVTAAAPRSTMGSNLSGDMVVGIEDHAAQKKKRGRPPGTGKKPGHLSPPTGNAFSGTAGTSFTPHIITASPSEDVAAKIVAFANQSSKAVCVLSAMGSVSRVVLRHTADASSPIMSSRVVHASAAPPYNNHPAAIYEGFYEILSLSGSYSYSLSEGEQSGGLRVTLCSPERNVIGGVLAGPLVAASTVQVVVGSFHQGGSRPKSSKKEKAAAGKQQQQQAFSSVDPLTGASPSSAGGGHNQNLTPPSVTTGGGWPSSGVFDTTRSSSIDINSSRG